jgi:RNA polymerase sigma factor (sigma-70 family)
MEAKMLEYEGLVISTVRYWRHMITSDMEDEDIAQELRMKVWRALETFDPSKGYPERNHVFGAVRNRVKDLIGKKRRENFEEPNSSMHHDAVYGESGVSGRDVAVVEKMRELGEIRSSTGTTDLLIGLSKSEQRVAVMMIQGFNAPEIAGELQLAVSAVRVQIAKIREHVSVLLVERSQT